MYRQLNTRIAVNAVITDLGHDITRLSDQVLAVKGKVLEINRKIPEPSK